LTSTDYACLFFVGLCVQARGRKTCLKRLNAPKHWMLDKMSGVFAPRPSTGPHKLRECLPVILILRNRLKYAVNAQEALSISMRKMVKVDGKVRTDPRYPTGLMDVVSIEKTGEIFRMVYDVKGRYALNPIDKAEAKFKLCKITEVYMGVNKTPMATTHDGRTLRYPDPMLKQGDTIKLDLETGKPTEIFKYAVGNIVLITSGANRGRVGVLQTIQPHPGSFEIISVKDSTGAVFATRRAAAFIIGNQNRPAISLPVGKGIKRSIIEEKADRDKRAANRK
jgi:small subunit ribosomal protein S4e